MKKRIASLMLALCLILSAVPATVLAVNEFPVVPITQEEPTQPTQPVCVHSWADGVCAKCGAVCGHNWVDHVCTVCRDEQTSITRLGATLNYENRISVVTLFKLTGVDRDEVIRYFQEHPGEVCLGEGITVKNLSDGPSLAIAGFISKVSAAQA